MQIPEKLLYSKDHEWLLVEGDIGTIGITHYAQRELGDIVYVEIESLDETLDEGEVFGTIEAVKTVSDLFMPVSGTVIELNDRLEEQPELVNQDPYGDAWMIKIRLTDTAQLSDLMSAEAYKDHLGE